MWTCLSFKRARVKKFLTCLRFTATNIPFVFMSGNTEMLMGSKWQHFALCIQKAFQNSYDCDLAFSASDRWAVFSHAEKEACSLICPPTLSEETEQMECPAQTWRQPHSGCSGSLFLLGSTLRIHTYTRWEQKQNPVVCESTTEAGVFLIFLWTSHYRLSNVTPSPPCKQTVHSESEQYWKFLQKGEVFGTDSQLGGWPLCVCK